MDHLSGVEYWVLIYGSPDGPRYSVCSLDGRLLQADLPADEVYKAFPTLDVEGMWVDPPNGAEPGAAGMNKALMLAEPAR